MIRGSNDVIIAYALEHGINLVVVGPEAPLVGGLVDRCIEVGIPAFGHSAAASELEGSKIFTKKLCDANGIPTAPWVAAYDYESARDLIFATQDPQVIKADGLCGGKGVFVPDSHLEAASAAHALMVESVCGAGGNAIVIENKLRGKEASFMCLCLNEVAVPLEPAGDFKRAYDGDKGLNTGGMGSFSPVPYMGPELQSVTMERIILPTVRAMARMGRPLSGVLYAGLMLTEDGPTLLEHNVRFGDPEFQAIIARLRTDITPYLDAIARRDQERLLMLGPLQFSRDVSVCVTLSVDGYPENPHVGHLITDVGDLPGTMLFRAGMQLKDGQWFTSSGRVASAVGRGRDFPTARQRAYERAGRVLYSHKRVRSDIAANL